MNKKKKFGFTLGEILIAIVVIGTIAMLILPQLVLGQKAARAKAQFNTAYSLLSNSISDMESDDIPLNPAVYESGTKVLATELKKYSRISVDCGDFSSRINGVSKNSSACFFDNTYKSFSNHAIDLELFDDGGFVMKNGMLVETEYGGKGRGVYVHVDINGKSNPPNKWGWDVFSFELVNNDLLPAGAPGTKYSSKENREKYCKKDSTDNLNGLTCAYFALYNEKYFKEVYRGF